VRLLTENRIASFGQPSFSMSLSCFPAGVFR
jgi:hypothetical protein